jgi:hypothetical protein
MLSSRFTKYLFITPTCTKINPGKMMCKLPNASYKHGWLVKYPCAIFPQSSLTFWQDGLNFCTLKKYRGCFNTIVRIMKTGNLLNNRSFLPFTSSIVSVLIIKGLRPMLRIKNVSLSSHFLMTTTFNAQYDPLKLIYNSICYSKHTYIATVFYLKEPFRNIYNNARSK